MPVRVAIICACALGFGILQAGLAAAEDLDPGQTRALVVGKLFSYTCFDGTAGLGRIFGDRWIGLRLLRLPSAKPASTLGRRSG
jgi:hypothetical protein